MLAKCKSEPEFCLPAPSSSKGLDEPDDGKMQTKFVKKRTRRKRKRRLSGDEASNERDKDKSRAAAEGSEKMISDRLVALLLLSAVCAAHFRSASASPLADFDGK